MKASTCRGASTSSCTDTRPPAGVNLRRVVEQIVDDLAEMLLIALNDDRGESRARELDIAKLVDTLFLMICPTVHEHLHLLARLACVLKSADFRKLLLSHPDKTRLVSAIRAEEEAFAGKRELQET